MVGRVATTVDYNSKDNEYLRTSVEKPEHNYGELTVIVTTFNELNQYSSYGISWIHSSDFGGLTSP